MMKSFVVVRALFATVAGQNQGCHPLDGSIFTVMVKGDDPSGEKWVSRTDAHHWMVATNVQADAMPVYLKAASDCGVYYLQNKWINEDGWISFDEDCGSWIQAIYSEENAMPTRFRAEAGNNEYKLESTRSGKFVSYSDQDESECRTMHEMNSLHTTSTESDAMIVRLVPESQASPVLHTVHRSISGEFQCEDSPCNSLTFDLSYGIGTPALRDGDHNPVACPDGLGQCSNWLWTVQISPLPNSNIFRVICSGDGTNKVYNSIDGYSWSFHSTFECNQDFTITSSSPFLGVVFAAPEEASIAEIEFHGPSGATPDEDGGDAYDSSFSHHRAVDFSYLRPHCEPGNHSYFASNECTDACPEYFAATPPSNECLPLLTHHVTIMPDPNVTVSQEANGNVHLHITLPSLPPHFFEGVSTSFAVDVKPDTEHFEVNSSCNFEFQSVYDIMDDASHNGGWTHSNALVGTDINTHHKYGSIRGMFEGASWVENVFTVPRNTPVRVSMRLILEGAAVEQYDSVWINVNRVRKLTATRDDMCPLGYSYHSSGCRIDVLIDLDDSISGEIEIRIGSHIIGNDKLWGFQNLKLAVPMLTADLTYAQLNDSCILGNTPDSHEIIRAGQVGVFVLGGAEIIYELLTPLTIHFPKWTSGTWTPVTIWLPLVAPEVNMTAAPFLSDLLLYENNEYGAVKRLPIYRVGSTIWAEQTISEQLSMEVIKVFLSNSGDPTNSPAVVYNFTDSKDFEMHSSEAGQIRFSIRAVAVCDACYLHVISLVSHSRRLSPHHHSRRLQSSDDQTEVQTENAPAIASFPVDMWFPELEPAADSSTPLQAIPFWIFGMSLLTSPLGS